MTTTRVKLGVRLAAFLLIAGGALGIVGGIMLLRGNRSSGDWTGLIAPLASFPVFAWTSLKGLDLWRGRPSGYWWCTRLLALQIPIVTIRRLTYEYSVGFSARISFGNTRQSFGADIGSSLNLFSSAAHGWMAGINIVALGLFAYLLHQSRACRADLYEMIESEPSRR